ncbi:GMC family oxidoreductase [Methyloligella sp. 2.7D]|uniref:GMC oxidoreductase n=1 Tax=unclassified Methyloligella TaxID=2625955 RepID=UPI00157C1742|nr:GMC family oxidoreductase [Methyloligella sp. GL2]QKP76190.1 GMC family oxidoreductase [Methyloligella sp. GL2]
MLTDLQTLDDGASLKAPICIFGAGAAGITLALELEKQNIPCLLLEGGGLTFQEESQNIYKGEVIGDQNTDIAYSRLREFGGTTGHWTGQCLPLDPIDFEKREALPYSGWPITRADLDPFYERAQPYLQLGPFAYAPSDWNLEGPKLPLNPEKVAFGIFQYSPPTRFGETYRAPIETSKTIQCYYHANLTDLVIDEAGQITGAEVQTFGGKTMSVSADRFVIAAGGIENARLLLNFTKQRPAGIGNQHDLVGRYFMDHMNCKLGTFLPADPAINLSRYLAQIVDGTPLRVNLRLPAEVIEKQGLRNNALLLEPVWQSESHNDEFRDHSWLAFSSIAKSLAHGNPPDQFPSKLCTILDQPSSVAVGISRHLMREVVPHGELQSVFFKQDAEQAPNPDSRVTLEDATDRFGMKRAVLDWRITEDDLLSLRKTHELIGVAIGEAGLGRVKLGLGLPPNDDDIYTGYHHIGTTRMHDDPKQGVVDADCRVHSTKNLYIAGSSVFTTEGTANPTLTITALAIRLADHLGREAGDGQRHVGRNDAGQNQAGGDR